MFNANVLGLVVVCSSCRCQLVGLVLEHTHAHIYIYKHKHALTVVFVVWGVILDCRNGFLRK